MPARVQKIDVPKSVLGEGPVWSERDQCLYFVDIVSHRVEAYWPGTRDHRWWQFDAFTGSLGECRSGGLIVALGDRVVWFDPKQGLGSIRTIAVLEQDRPENRLNDGKVDPWGRFWVGSMQADEAGSRGRLWCLAPDGTVNLHLDGIGVPNSIAFDRKRHRMYFADSFSGTIQKSTLDDARQPKGWTTFAKADKGSPDGSCTDADGYLWNAQWAGWRVVRYSPEGDIDRVIEIPTSRPSSCAFGGPDFKTLFVTSAEYKMSPQEKQQDPDAGSLYCIDFEDAQGLPSDYFAI
jgi:L-arabinonolactonase